MFHPSAPWNYPDSWTFSINSSGPAAQVWWGWGPGQENLSILGFLVDSLYSARALLVKCDVTDTVWAHEWNTACVILVSDPWRYFYTSNIWHLKAEKCVLLHNEFCPCLVFSIRRHHSASARISGCGRQLDGKAAKSQCPPPPASPSESHGGGWDFRKEPMPVMTFASGVCFRGLL